MASNCNSAADVWLRRNDGSFIRHHGNIHSSIAPAWLSGKESVQCHKVKAVVALLQH